MAMSSGMTQIPNTASTSPKKMQDLAPETHLVRLAVIVQIKEASLTT